MAKPKSGSSLSARLTLGGLSSAMRGTLLNIELSNSLKGGSGIFPFRDPVFYGNRERAKTLKGKKRLNNRGPGMGVRMILTPITGICLPSAHSCLLSLSSPQLHSPLYAVPVASVPLFPNPSPRSFLKI